MKKDLFDDIVVVKRSGQRVNFNGTKIAIAIKLAFDDTYETYDEKDVNLVYTDVINTILKDYKNRKTISVEDIQDLIEKVLLIHKFDKVHENFNSYRLKRKASRETFKDKETHKFNKIIEGITSSIQNNSNKKIYPSLVSYGTSILKEYSKKDSRIKIITTKEHFGQSHARNLAIEKAKGEYIGFVDADDFAENLPL